MVTNSGTAENPTVSDNRMAMCGYFKLMTEDEAAREPSTAVNEPCNFIPASGY